MRRREVITLLGSAADCLAAGGLGRLTSANGGARKGMGALIVADVLGTKLNHVFGR